jgi:hypothetical protein
MYHRAGLREVDRLWSFTRPGREADVTDTPVG